MLLPNQYIYRFVKDSSVYPLVLFHNWYLIFILLSKTLLLKRRSDMNTRCDYPGKYGSTSATTWNKHKQIGEFYIFLFIF